MLACRSDGRMNRAGLALFMLLGLAAPACVHATDIVFRVEQATNLDMDADRLAAMLASDTVEVRVTMAPVIALPGWTGRIGLCGVSSIRDVCIKKRWRSVYLRGSKVQRTDNALRFHVPGWHWFGVMPYRPAGPVRVSLPPFWPGDLPVNIDASLFELEKDAAVQPLVDMHLPAPYVGIASWRVVARVWGGGEARGNKDAEAAPVWRVTQCDPGIGLDDTVMPQLRSYRRASALADWARALADNAWWAAQIGGVQLGQGVAAGAAGLVEWRDVSVTRGDRPLRYLSVQESRLVSSACPGRTRHEYTWLGGALTAATMQEIPDAFPDDAMCESVQATSRQVLWWDGALERHSRHTGPAEFEAWERWRHAEPACNDRAGSAAPATQDIERDAAYWQGVIGRPEPQ